MSAVLARLDRMEALLRRDGWCRGDMINVNGQRCFLGAAYDRPDKAWPDPEGDQIVELGRAITGMSMAFWNDIPGRTVEEVFEVIGLIRKELE